MVMVKGMETFTARLASFDVSHPATKRRTSAAKAAKTLKWQHKQPSPAQLAKAGFFYRPTSSCPDNAVCFLCHKGLDGWEKEDDPVVEHLKHSPGCGWAIVVGIERDVELGTIGKENPMDERMLAARLATFGDVWPHNGKRGWACKTQKMVEAGWYFSPSTESEDFVRCPYCSLSLDGWEPKDNPIDEHQRRSPNCMFFNMTQLPTLEPSKTKKGRVSKASRLSTQSNLEAPPKGSSLREVEVKGRVNALTTATETTSSAMPVHAGKKGGRGNKTIPTLHKRTTQKADGPKLASKYCEPEDDDFEVKVKTPPKTAFRGKKRKSDERDIAEARGNNTSAVEAQAAQSPPAKRRATRSRDSVAKSQSTPIDPISNDHDVDTQMLDAGSMPPPPKVVSKKEPRRGQKRAPSSTRNVSTASTASKASLRALIPHDAEIDADLEADLDRPLSDEGSELETVIVKPISRRLTRTRPGTKNPTASIAPARKFTRASLVTDHPRVRAEDDAEVVMQQVPASAVETAPEVESIMIDAPKTRTPAKISRPIMKITQENIEKVESRLEVVIDADPHPEIKYEASVPPLQADQRLARPHEEAIQSPVKPNGIETAQGDPRTNKSEKSPVPPGHRKSALSLSAKLTQEETPTPSPQSSDAENHPPSSRPSASRPPLTTLSPSKTQTTYIPLAASTPSEGHSKKTSRLQSTAPWTAVDLDRVFQATESKMYDLVNFFQGDGLTTPEKSMNVEEWIIFNALKGEEKLRGECERMVGRFEDEGVRALKALEGIAVIDG